MKCFFFLRCCCFFCVFFGCCCTQPLRATDQATHTPSSCLESFNRKMLHFNLTLDGMLMRPLMEMYRQAVPSVLRRASSSFLQNLSEPLSFISNIFQLRFKDAGKNLCRFVLNSTVGFFGVMDLASRGGMPCPKQDMTHVFKNTGAATGPFLILPVIGAVYLRELAGMVSHLLFNPVNIFLRIYMPATFSGINALGIMNEREKYDLAFQEIYRSSDAYSTLKTLYDISTGNLTSSENIYEQDDDAFAFFNEDEA